MKRTAIALAAILSCLWLLGGAAPSQAAPDSFFDIFLESVSAGPPYPTPPVVTIVGNMVDGSITQTGTVKMGLRNAHGIPPELQFGASGHSRGGGGGGGGYRIDSFFDVFFEVTGPVPDPLPTSFFDIFLEIYDTGGGGGTLVTLHPEYAVGDTRRYFDVSQIDSFFDIYYRIDSGGGIQDYHLQGTCQAPDSFFDVFLEMAPGHSAPDSFFDVFVEINIPETTDIGLPLFTIRTSGTYLPNPVPVQTTTWSGIKSLYDH
jgi:hypothetical protein